jgi:N4-gp56 family major capsid protein
MPFTALNYPVASGDPLAEISWSTITHIESQEENFFSMNGLAAKDSGREDAHQRRVGAPIILKDELRKGPGDEVRMRMRRQLTRTPRTSALTYGSTSMLGQEESLVWMDVSVYLALLKNAVGNDSPDLFGHRTSIDMERESEDALKEWLIENHEEAMLDAFYDGAPYFAIQSLAAVSTVAHPRTYYAGGAADAASLTGTGILNAGEALRQRSYAINRRLNPIRHAGKKCFAVLGDTFVCNDLRNDPQFQAAQQANGRGSDNPLLSGAIGEYNGNFYFEYERMRQPSSGANAANIGQMALLGADAIAVAYGSEPRIVPRVETAYGDRWGRAIRQVFGASRTDFQTSDNATTINQSSAQWNVWTERDEFAQ